MTFGNGDFYFLVLGITQRFAMFESDIVPNDIRANVGDETVQFFQAQKQI